MRSSLEIRAEMNSLENDLDSLKRKFNVVGQIISDGNSCHQDVINLLKIFEKIIDYIGIANSCFSTQSGDKIEQFKFKVNHLSDIFENTNNQVGVLLSLLSNALTDLNNLQHKIQDSITGLSSQINRLRYEYDNAVLREKTSKSGN